MRFEGILPAIITPIDKNEQLNVKELEKMLEKLIGEGVDGFYVLGGTGEGLKVTKELHMAMTRETLRIVAGRVPCIIHVARMQYSEMIELAKYAESVGAAAVSAIPPIYYDYNEDEIYAYFKTLAESVNIPVIIYNNSATRVSFSTALLNKLFDIPNLMGIKWTNPNYLSVIDFRRTRDDVNIINGPDELLALGLTAGCDAGIGTTYSLMVPYFKKVYNGVKSGNMEEALKYQQLISGIIIAMAPFEVLKATKFLLSKQGLDVNYNFYPIAPYTKEEEEALLKAVREAGLEV